MNMEQWRNDIFAGETEVLGENLPSATLSTTNPTWIDPGANPGLRGERPVTNGLSHGTALPCAFVLLYSVMIRVYGEDYNEWSSLACNAWPSWPCIRCDAQLCFNINDIRLDGFVFVHLDVLDMDFIIILCLSLVC
jgi:hypothetical protein